MSIRWRDATEFGSFRHVIEHGPYCGAEIPQSVFRVWFDRSYVLIVESDGQTLGQVFVANEDAADGRRFDNLFFLWLDPSARGKGIGSQLIAAISIRAAARGADVLLTVDVENVRAAALYRRLGFEEYARSFYVATLSRDGAIIITDPIEIVYMQRHRETKWNSVTSSAR
jgi:ribosomal protein S18 acetylase RimI-like enzyme